MNTVITSLRTLFLMTILLGVLYPLAITAIGKIAFPIKSQGSLVGSGETVLGSELIAQKFTGPRYFHPRPSAIDWKAEGSGASQKSATSGDLRKSFEERKKILGEAAPSDLLWASGSGLDPHISVEAANFQAPRIASVRGIPVADVTRLVRNITEDRFLGFLGQPRVNVLNLNRLLDKSQTR